MWDREVLFVSAVMQQSIPTHAQPATLVNIARPARIQPPLLASLAWTLIGRTPIALALNAMPTA